MKNQNNKRLLIGVAVGTVLLMLLLSLFIFKPGQFKVTSVSPAGDELPTSTRLITVVFSHALAEKDVQPEDFVTTNQNTAIETSIKEKELNITLTEAPSTEQEFIVTLNNIRSSGGKELSIRFRFVPQYVPFNELPKAEKERQEQRAYLPENEHPLLKLLPYYVFDYRINYVTDKNFGTGGSWQGEKDNFRVIIETYAVPGESLEQYTADTKSIRNQALEFIRSLGVDPENDIHYVFSPSDEQLPDYATGNTEFTGDGVNPDEFESGTSDSPAP